MNVADSERGFRVVFGSRRGADHPDVVLTGFSDVVGGLLGSIGLPLGLSVIRGGSPVSRRVLAAAIAADAIIENAPGYIVAADVDGHPVDLIAQQTARWTRDALVDPLALKVEPGRAAIELKRLIPQAPAGVVVYDCADEYGRVDWPWMDSLAEKKSCSLLGVGFHTPVAGSRCVIECETLTPSSTYELHVRSRVMTGLHSGRAVSWSYDTARGEMLRTD